MNEGDSESETARAGRWARLRDRLSTQLLPALAVTFAAVVFLGPAKQRPAVAVRVLGVPEPASPIAVRLESVRRLFSVDDHVPIDEVTVEASADGEPAGTWRGAIGDDGAAEVSLFPKHAPSHAVAIVIQDRKGTVLGAGSIPVRRPGTTFATLATIAGHGSGDLDIRVDALRGRLAAQFSDGLRISVAPRDGSAPSPVDIDASALGAKLVPEHASLAQEKSAIITVTPLAHDVELSIKARDHKGKAGTWEGTLPIVPGAMWLDPKSSVGPKEASLEIASPVPHERAYLSLYGEQGRVFGALVPLSQSPDGFFRGHVTGAITGGQRMLFAVLSSDPLDRGVGTTAWPLRPAEGAVPVRRVELLLDGLPAAEARENERARKARMAGIAVIVAAAVAQILLMIAQNRRAQRQLEEHFRRVTANATERLRTAEDATDAEGLPRADAPSTADVLATAKGSPALRGAIFLALIALAFAMVAALATFR